MPKAIAPTVAEINIARFNKSAIQFASGRLWGKVAVACGSAWSETQEADPSATQASLRLSQNLGHVDPHFCWQIEYL